MPTYEHVKDAYKRIHCFLPRTPVQTSSTVDNIVGANTRIIFKCENFQKTGSFKARGALNSVLKLRQDTPGASGVVTHSSGNHGQALAWAARTADLPCTVVVPRTAPANKCEAIKEYGADIVFCEPTPQARESTCQEVFEKTGRVIIPPFDHEDVIAGQGTIAVEFLEQVPELDAILVPVSGAGMLSGIAIAAKAIKPNIKVYAVEPFGKDLETSLKAGERRWPNPPGVLTDSIADALRLQQVGHLTFPILLQLVEPTVFSVTNEEIVAAMRFVWQRMKLVVEPSSATGVAAIFSAKFKQFCSGLRVGVILCGGNADIDNLPWK